MNRGFRFKTHIVPCSDIGDIDFDKVSNGSEKEATLLVYNSNPNVVTFDGFSKSTSDLLIVDVEKVTNRQGQDIEPFWAGGSDLSEPVLNSKVQTSLEKLILNPFETASIVFRLAPSDASSSILNSTFSVVTGAGFESKIEFNYSYDITEGTMDTSPEIVKFKPCF
mmetsp:Transcript_29356/g.44263  ORF Transcript_29356/g.44263 Transcript_29356/m.44263 type:complete len:166 (-) Transcript_29356:8794-9291(-)